MCELQPPMTSVLTLVLLLFCSFFKRETEKVLKIKKGGGAVLNKTHIEISDIFIQTMKGLKQKISLHLPWNVLKFVFCICICQHLYTIRNRYHYIFKDMHDLKQMVHSK